MSSERACGKYRAILCLLALCLLLSVTGCKKSEPMEPPTEAVNTAVPEEETAPEPEEPQISEEVEEADMTITIDGQQISVTWEDNDSVDALRQLAKETTITVQMSMYGGFEQVGALGASLPRDDVQTTTQAGDIVLYSGNQIVVFYGSNSWAYTRLGRIEGKSEAELSEMLGQNDVTLTIACEN